VDDDTFRRPVGRAAGGPRGQESLSGARRASRQHSAQRALTEWVVAIGIAVLVAFVIKTFVLQAFVIPSGSMEDTLQIGDRVLVRKIAFDIDDVQRGDIVVFRNPARLPSEPEHLIKRVVGLPGDTLESRDGVVFVNGDRIEEGYLKPGSATDRLPPTEVPDGSLWVMGDNRRASEDSRAKGPIPADDLVGRAVVRIWPVSRIDLI
jgi:signal peptidase I